MSFYLYRIFKDDETLYIGKGTGSRLARQKRRFQANGEIVARFEDEDEAYREEVKLIAAYAPPLNKHPGGLGGRAGAWQQQELPNGFTAEGLRIAAPHIARLLVIWKRDNSLSGILSVLGGYIKAHGIEALSMAVLPHLSRLVRNDLALENKP